MNFVNFGTKTQNENEIANEKIQRSLLGKWNTKRSAFLSKFVKIFGISGKFCI